MLVIGEKVERLRKERGLTKTKLASKAGISVEALSKILAGKTKPSSPTLKKLAMALNVSRFELDSKSLLEDLSGQNIGTEIEKKRLENKMTLDELSETIGINKEALKAIILGYEKPMLLNIKKLADIFGVSVFDLDPEITARCKSPQSIGEKVRELRMEMGLSQNKLSIMLDMAVNDLCLIENGRKKISYEALKKFLEFFGCKVLDLSAKNLIKGLSGRCLKKVLKLKRLSRRMTLEGLAKESGISIDIIKEIY